LYEPKATSKPFNSDETFCFWEVVRLSLVSAALSLPTSALPFATNASPDDLSKALEPTIEGLSMRALAVEKRMSSSFMAFDDNDVNRRES
jgi:hypothetical protein